MVGKPPVHGGTCVSVSLLVRHSVAIAETKERSLFKVILSGSASTAGTFSVLLSFFKVHFK